MRRAFRGTSHQLTFDTLSAEHIAGHDVVVPLTIPDLKILCRAGDPVRGNPLPIPSLESVVLCDDKLLFNHALIDAGFGTHVPRMSAHPFYPYIVKRRIDEWGAHSRIVSSWAQERELAGRYDGPDYFRQELIPGTREYATHIVFEHGRIRYVLTIEYVFAEVIFIKGRTRCAHVAQVRNPECMDIFAAILGAIGFHGLCCVNYKLIDGKPLIFEINPRFGYSLCPHFPHLLKCLRPRLRNWLPRPLPLGAQA